MNRTRIEILKNSILAASGLMLFAVGVYLVIQAGIGAAPWDVFCLGLSDTLGILYGNASLLISVVLIVIDLILGEKIGIGTILDAVVVGKTVDLLNWLGLIGTEHSLPVSLVMIFLGFFLEGFSQYLYMKAGLSCGPRDSFQLALSRRMPGIPIGVVNIFILAVVCVIGLLLGGPFGIATVIAPAACGLLQQLSFNLMKFEPKDVTHQSLLVSLRIFIGRQK